MRQIHLLAIAGTSIWLVVGMVGHVAFARENSGILPLGGTYTVTDGPYEGTHWGESAEAIDLAAKAGTPVFPFKPGVVIFARDGDNLGFGWNVEVRHDDGTVSRYAHLRKITVEEGQTVGYATKLGEVGNTGNCKGVNGGYHLHFDVRDAKGHPVSVRYLVNWNDGCPASPTKDTCGAPGGSATGPSLASRQQLDEQGGNGDDGAPESGGAQGCSHLRATTRSANCYIADESFLAIEVDYLGFERGERLTVTADYPCIKESFSTLTDGSELRAPENAYWSFRNDFLQHCGSGWYTQTLEGKSSGHVASIRFYWGH